MTQVAEHGGSFIETVGILSRKESQRHSNQINQTDPIPARRLANNRNLSDGEGSHAPCDDHFPCSA
jgi:hypothetical protein